MSAVEQWLQASERLTGALKDAGRLFGSTTSQAFTGHLTAEWEATNADGIASQAILNERLPQLLLLNLIRERVARTERPVLVTALMKYAFLLQMEGSARRRLYRFVPYHYGPFAKQLYDDLEQLVQGRVVRLDNDQDEEKTRITLVDMAKADEMLADVPDEFKADVASIIDTYGTLDHGNLLRAVYKKYPAYARNSKIKEAR